MSTPIRILHVFGKMNRGGAETLIMNIYRNINRSLIQFDFLVHTEDKCDYDDEIRQLGGKIFSIPPYEGVNHFKYKRILNNFFSSHSEHHVVHGHVRSTASIYLKIANSYNKKTIAHSHSTSSGSGFTSLYKDFLQYFIRYNADYFFACSMDAGEWLFGKNIVNSQRYYLVKNAIDINKFKFNKYLRNELREKLNLENNNVIGHVGRFTDEKNHSFLIDILEEILDVDKSYKLLLIGVGPLENYIKKIVTERKLDNYVIFLGNTSYVEKYLNAMDIFVFPSIYEGLGISVIEAQASGLPCVISNSIPEEVVASHNVKSLDLNHPAEVWSNTIINIAKVFKREDLSHELRGNGYDIHSLTHWVSNFYWELNQNY